MSQSQKQPNLRKQILTYLLMQRNETFHKGIQGIIVPPKKKKKESK